jgi:hypothetical protein
MARPDFLEAGEGGPDRSADRGLLVPATRNPKNPSGPRNSRSRSTAPENPCIAPGQRRLPSRIVFPEGRAKNRLRGEPLRRSGAAKQLLRRRGSTSAAARCPSDADFGVARRAGGEGVPILETGPVPIGVVGVARTPAPRPGDNPACEVLRVDVDQFRRQATQPSLPTEYAFPSGRRKTQGFRHPNDTVIWILRRPDWTWGGWAAIQVASPSAERSGTRGQESLEEGQRAAQIRLFRENSEAPGGVGFLHDRLTS